MGPVGVGERVSAAERVAVAGACWGLVLAGFAAGVLFTLAWLGRLPWQ